MGSFIFRWPESSPISHVWDMSSTFVLYSDSRNGLRPYRIDAVEQCRIRRIGPYTSTSELNNRRQPCVAMVASSIGAVTSSGLEASEAWLASSVITFFAPSLPDIIFSSRLQTTAFDGKYRCAVTCCLN
jgi:hypothetical protein